MRENMLSWVGLISTRIEGYMLLRAGLILLGNCPKANPTLRRIMRDRQMIQLELFQQLRLVFRHAKSEPFHGY